MQQAASSALIGVSWILAGIALGPLRAEAQRLFESHEPLRFTLEAPLGQVIRDARQDKDDSAHAAVLRAGEQAIPVRLSAFGKTRLSVCQVPPLKMTVDPADVAGTVFEGHETLRLVTHCGAGNQSGRFVLLEYLVYRMYGLLTQPALSVRLVEIEYRDLAGQRPGRPALAFFVEDIGRAAARHGLEWLTIERQQLDELDGEEVSLFTLFQFAIGNTDWSVLTGPEGERCCHNVAVLGDPQGGPRHLLPFDFDSSGIVDAPYAAPIESLGITRVTQRLYRGFCRNSEHLPNSIARFRELEPRLEELVDDPSLPYPRVRVLAGNFLDRFFSTIADPKKLDKRIRRRCRGR